MSMPLKLNAAARSAIASGRIRMVELGCGPRKRFADSIAIDAIDFPVVDIVGDVFDALAALPAASVETIHAAHFFEHFQDQPKLLAACARVLAPDSRLEITVPHFSNPFFYSDYTHRTAFGLYSMSYLVKDDLLRRKVPSYGAEPQFQLEDVRLTFKSPRKYSIRNVFLRSFGILINLSRYTQELYEEIYSKLVPCYEVTFTCRRLAGSAAS